MQDSSPELDSDIAGRADHPSDLPVLTAAPGCSFSHESILAVYISACGGGMEPEGNMPDESAFTPVGCVRAAEPCGPSSTPFAGARVGDQSW
jgi:hypothetical protein